MLAPELVLLVALEIFRNHWNRLRPGFDEYRC
jgi:hypothetical protein